MDADRPDPPLALAGVAGIFPSARRPAGCPRCPRSTPDGPRVAPIRGVRRKLGGFKEPLYNIVMGPPLLAPGSLVMVGAIGLLAAAVERERL
ncbi:MAG: hypothetical protein WKF41_15985 [Gaiellaceae bacterium]